MWTIWEYRTTQRCCPWQSCLPIDGRLSRLEDYIARRDFTRCVEQDMTNGIIAEAFEMDRDDLSAYARRASECESHKRDHLSGKVRTLPPGEDWDDDEWQD